MIDLHTILTTLHDATAIKISGISKNLAPLNKEAIAFVTDKVGPSLDIPPSVLLIAKGETANLSAAVEPYEIATLQFLQTRLYSLFSHL